MGNTAEVLAKATFNGIQCLKPRLNGHDEDLDVMDKTNQFFTVTNNNF